MTKKSVKKKVKKKKTTKKRAAKKSVEKKVVTKIIHQHIPAQEDISYHKLTSNFVALQKVLTNLAVRLDDVSTKIGKLLDLFEISAKALAEKNFEIGGIPGRGIEKKLDNLLEQNKVIARGLTLMHDRLSGDMLSSPEAIPSEAPLPSIKKPTIPSSKKEIKEIPQTPPQFQPSAITQTPIPSQYNRRGMPPKTSQPTPEQTKEQAMKGYQKSLPTVSPESTKEDIQFTPTKDIQR